MELSNFGIQNIDSISSYTLKSTRDRDELVIKLKDKRFGFLNKQKRAVFKRNERAITLNNEIVMHHEISPMLLQILDSLEASKIKKKQSISFI